LRKRIQMNDKFPAATISKRERLYDLLKQAFLLLDDGDRRLFETYNLTPPRFYAMHHICEEPGISSSELSDRLLCDKSNVTRIVKGLEKQGLLQRKPHESDGRTLRLFLTHRGSAVCGQVQTAHKQYNGARLDVITPNMRDTLIDNLSTLVNTLEENLQFLPQNGASLTEEAEKGGDGKQ
jgi:DNA-binding MarR family transcriptional regulator